jgi:hypothetical protein
MVGVPTAKILSVHKKLHDDYEVSHVIKRETRRMGPILRYLLSQHLNEETEETERTNVFRLEDTVWLTEDVMHLVRTPSVLPA